MSDLLTPLKITGNITSGVATYPPGAEYGPRILEDYELVWMIDGDAEYGWGDNVWHAPAGSIVLCRPGASDYFRWDRNRRTRHAFTHFMVESSPDHWPGEREWPFVRTMPADDIVRPLFRHLLTWHGNQPAEQSQLMISMMMDVFVTGNVAAEAIERERWPDAVLLVTAYIRKTFDEDPARSISLSELAGVASMTPEHLCRIFKSSVGRSPMELVRISRLNYASSLLERSNYTISQISSLCGFANPFHFSRLYKQHFGKSPKFAR